MSEINKNWKPPVYDYLPKLVSSGRSREEVRASIKARQEKDLALLRRVFIANAKAGKELVSDE